MEDGPHKKIIKALCTEQLLPLGVFQKGTSRTYIDDNGWFFTVIEFQPSDWSKGTYLNVAMHFLWNEKQYISFDFADRFCRVGEYIAYENDEQFTREVAKYVAEAVKWVKFYRKLCDPKAAKRYAKKWALLHPNHRGVDQLCMVERLDDDEVVQRIRRTRTFWRSQPSMKKMKHNSVYDD